MQIEKTLIFILNNGLTNQVLAVGFDRENQKVLVYILNPAYLNSVSSLIAEHQWKAKFLQSRLNQKRLDIVILHELQAVIQLGLFGQNLLISQNHFFKGENRESSEPMLTIYVPYDPKNMTLSF